MATIDGDWHLGIGDPTPVGWFTVVAYAVAAALCWRAQVLAEQSGRDRHRLGRHRRFWLVSTVFMALLCINKQLDLQTELTDIGRRMALHEGWYGIRHVVQIDFIAAVGVAGVAVLAVLAWWSWPLTLGRALALGGQVALAAFVLIRASSFHHVDIFLNETALGLRWNWIIELAGIALIALGARREAADGVRPGRRTAA